MSEVRETEICQTLASIIGDVLSADVSLTDLEAKLIEDYGANSMDMVDIVERIERKLKVKVANDRVLELKTFGDIVELVRSQRSDF